MILLEILFLLVCLMLIFMVVITPSQSEGLASAFGGMGSESFFGTKAHQHISKFTIFLAVGFLALTIALNLGGKGSGKPASVLQDSANPTESPAASPHPGPGK